MSTREMLFFALGFTTCVGVALAVGTLHGLVGHYGPFMWTGWAATTLFVLAMLKGNARRSTR